jgi:Family of unknown function (DUF5946)
MTTAMEQEAYNELTYYTLAHPDPSFIHQYVVDAFTAQTADEHTKPVAITFALVGLYLAVERNFSGKQVQRAHMQLAKMRKHWLTFQAPAQKGAVSVFDVLAAPPGQARDAMIRRWCAAVWDAWKESQQPIRDLAKTELGIGSN